MDPWCLFAASTLSGVLLVQEPAIALLVSLLILLLYMTKGWIQGQKAKACLVALALCLIQVGFASLSDRRLKHFEHSRQTLLALGPGPLRCEGKGWIEKIQYSNQAIKLLIKRDILHCEKDEKPVALDADIVSKIVLYTDETENPTWVRNQYVEWLADLATPTLFQNAELPDARPVLANQNAALSGAALFIAGDVYRGHKEEKTHDFGVFRNLLTWLDQPCWFGSGWMDFMRNRVRKVIRRDFSSERQAFSRALVLGDNALAPDDDLAFRDSGLSHLLAVSGMHLVLVIITFEKFIFSVFIRIYALASRYSLLSLTSALMLPFLWLYTDFAGGSSSAERAAYMLSFRYLARMMGCESSGTRSLALSCIAMCVISPLCLYDVSFILSAAATVGLLFFLPRFQNGLERFWPETEVANPSSFFSIANLSKSLFKYVQSTLLSCFSATIVVTPFLARMTPRLPLLSVVCNLVAIPLGEMFSLPLCLAHCLLEWFPAAQNGVLFVASQSIDLMRLVARYGASLPAFDVPMPTSAQLGILACLLAYCLTHGFSHKKRVYSAACMILVGSEMYARYKGCSRGDMRISFLDVGQGDSAIVDLPNGEVMLIDAGGFVGSPIDTGERVIAPLLRMRRISHVDYVVLSHPHPDHFLGFEKGLKNVSIGHFWDSGQGLDEGAGPKYSSWIRFLQKEKITIDRAENLCGTHMIGGATIQVIAPCPSYRPHTNANDNSLVIRASYKGKSALFVGDAEHEEELALLDWEKDHPNGLASNLLKVGHHGSRTSSSPQFLAAVSPEIAIVSCGARNRFGHPHAVTQIHLAKAHINAHYTYQSGGEMFVFRGDEPGATPLEQNTNRNSKL